jgi:hypothetical protein
VSNRRQINGSLQKKTAPQPKVPASDDQRLRRRTGDGQKTVQLPIAGKIAALRWSGEVPAQKRMNFCTKVLSGTVVGEVAPDGGVSRQSMEETKTALRGLGLKDDLQ